jgi:hypothetical protein
MARMGSTEVLPRAQYQVLCYRSYSKICSKSSLLPNLRTELPIYAPTGVTMQNIGVLVKTPKGKTHQIELDQNSSVRDLKEKIANTLRELQENAPEPGSQLLIFSGLSPSQNFCLAKFRIVGQRLKLTGEAFSRTVVTSPGPEFCPPLTNFQEFCVPGVTNLP